MGDYRALSAEGVAAPCARHPQWVLRGITLLVSIIGYFTRVNSRSTLTGILGTVFGLIGSLLGFAAVNQGDPKRIAMSFLFGLIGGVTGIMSVLPHDTMCKIVNDPSCPNYQDNQR
jgi:hypothetical protein